MDNLVSALLRLECLPPKMRGLVKEAIDEAQKRPGLTAVEIAVIQANEPDPIERQSLYAALLSGVPSERRVTKSGVPVPETSERRTQKRRSDESSSSGPSKKARLQERLIDPIPESHLVPKMAQKWVLVGDSNLRNLAEQELDYTAKKNEENRVTIGQCKGGATIKEADKILQRLQRGSHVVLMVGLVDIHGPHQLSQVLSDTRKMIATARRRDHNILLVTPPPSPRSYNDFDTRAVSELMLKAADEKIRVLDVRGLYVREGKVKANLYEHRNNWKDLHHLSPTGIQVLHEAITSNLPN